MAFIQSAHRFRNPVEIVCGCLNASTICKDLDLPAQSTAVIELATKLQFHTAAIQRKWKRRLYNVRNFYNKEFFILIINEKIHPPFSLSTHYHLLVSVAIRVHPKALNDSQS